MSAFGWGIALGSISTGLLFAPRAFKEPVGAGWGIVASGAIAALLVGQLFMPAGYAWLGLCSGFAITTIPFWYFGKSLIQKRETDEAERRAALAQERQHAQEVRAEIDAQKSAWIASQLSGWGPQVDGQVLNLEHKPKCILALEPNGRLLRFVSYDDREAFSLLADTTLAMSEIISLNVASPMIKKTMHRTQVVPTISKERRSPVGRAAVGGLLLGPIGVLVGAASGLNGSVTTELEHVQVADTVDAKGDPQLIIGTSNPCWPILKIRRLCL